MSDQQPQNPDENQTGDGTGGTPAGEASGLPEPVTPAEPPAVPEAAAPPATWPAPDAGQPPAPVPPPPAPVAPASPTSSNAIVALILAIASWAICPIVPAIVALVLAQSAQREIAAGQGRVQGAGLVTAAKIVSWINIGFWAALLVIGGFVVLLAAVAGS